MTEEDSLNLSVYPNENLQDELDLLKEIFFKEIIFTNWSDEYLDIKVSLTPSTGDRWDLKFVFLDVIITIHKIEYPKVTPPTFKLSHVRGISQEHQQRILDELSEFAASRLGDCILYELIELVQDNLTQNNMPAGNCPICLESFSGYCHFTITECTHYFHMACLNEHLKHVETTEDGLSEPRCPSCREILDDDYVEALQRNTNELGLKCNLHKPEKEKFSLSPSIIEQTRKYKQMFEAMYLKQKANNSFFTGDSHVLDLTSRSVVARSLENAQQQAVETSVFQSNIGGSSVTSSEVATTSSERPAQRLDHPLQDKSVTEKNAADESLIISFSNLLDTVAPDPHNNSQDKLGSTGSTVPSNMEDSQSELSVSLSHDSVQPVEKDDLCYTDDEQEEEKEELVVDPIDASISPMSNEDNAVDNQPDISEYTSFTKEAKIVNIEEETLEEINALNEENKEEGKEDEIEKIQDEVQEEIQENIQEEIQVEVQEEVQEEKQEEVQEEQQENGIDEEYEEEGATEEVKTEEVKPEEVKTEEAFEKEEQPSEECGEENLLEGEEEVFESTAEQVENVEEDEAEGEEEEEEEVFEVSEVSDVSEAFQRTVSFDENALPKNTESREIQTQTRRVKRNRNRRRSANRDGNYREGESGRGGAGGAGGRGGYHNHHQRGGGHHHHHHQEVDQVVYRRTDHGRGGNRTENCRSYHEGMDHGRAKHEYRRHSFTEQTWRADHQVDKRHQRQREYYQQQPPQQPRFKPPRILRQEALAQAKKLSQALSNQEHAPSMHKIPVSLYNPTAAGGAAPPPPFLHGYQMTQIPPHFYQAASNYHQNTRKLQQTPGHPQHLNNRLTENRQQNPAVRPSDLPAMSSGSALSQSGGVGHSTSATGTAASNKPALSPNSHKIFDVSRFQQSILRNNSPPTAPSTNTK